MATAATMEQKLSKARVEKLKRRLIRAVASKVGQDSNEKELEDMWENMQRTSKCDCKLLWKHMRAVTLKKLKRLLPANDMLQNITAIARLTMTDWLLFDLVLVHENIDVIGADLWDNTSQEPEALIDLFYLVDQYKAETLEGKPLIDAWLTITKLYNVGGRKCSPMLLQRRWYQMKKMTRQRFYNFWGSYKGHLANLDAAETYKPTALQVDIIKRYRRIVENLFPEWEELINCGKVIRAHEFDDRINEKRNGIKESLDTGPELELIEQKIETINLFQDSDSDTDSKDAGKTSNSDFSKVTVKREPENIDLTEITEEDNLNESINIPCETPYGEDDDPPPLVIDCRDFSNGINHKTGKIPTPKDGKLPHTQWDDNEIVKESDDIDNTFSAMVDSVSVDLMNSSAANDENEDSSASFNDVTAINNISSNLQIETPFFNIVSNEDHRDMEHSNEFKVKKEIHFDIDSDDHSAAEDIIKLEKNYDDYNDIDIQNNSTNLPIIKNVVSMMTKIEPTVTEETVKNILAQKAETLTSKWKCSNSEISQHLATCVETKTDAELLGDFSEIPSDLQFVDDGIIVIDNDEDTSIVNNQLKQTNGNSDENETAEIDLKLLLFPTVYTKKLDHMDVFRFIEFEHIRDKRILDVAYAESKPIDACRVKVQNISQSEDKVHLQKETDLNDEQHQVIDSLCQNILQSDIESDSFVQGDIKSKIKAIEQQSFNKHTGLRSDKDSVSSDEEDIITIQGYAKDKVHYKSWMLQKPHVKSYNPIQLCKNPDFNTRLKRLTAGFLSYETNRIYLKRCYPITIDLHKSFETKLIEGTLYLKGIDTCNNTPECVPSTETGIPVSLPIKNTATDDVAKLIDMTSSASTPIFLSCERNKVITLPDIAEIRRANQRLLTAEVAPIQIASNSPPVTILTTENSNESESVVKGKQENNSENLSSSDMANNIKTTYDPSREKSTDLSAESICSNTLRPNNKNKTLIAGYRPLVKPKVNWLEKGSYKLEENLLASDTVDKMLSLLCGNAANIEKVKKKKSYKIKEKQFSGNIGDKRKDDNIVSSTSFHQKSIQRCEKESKVIPNEVHRNEAKITKAKQNFLTRKRNKNVCCWAKRKILNPKGKLRHFCVEKCICCCREELLEKFQDDYFLEQFNQVKVPKLKHHVVPIFREKTNGALPTSGNNEDAPLSICVNGSNSNVNIPRCISKRKSLSLGNLIEAKITKVNPAKPLFELEIQLTNNGENKLDIKNLINDDEDNVCTVIKNDTNSEHTVSLLSSIDDTKVNCPQSEPNKLASSPPVFKVPRILRSQLELKRNMRETVSVIDQTQLNSGVPEKRTVRVKIKKQDKISSSPIYVGENKVLLSTIKSLNVVIDPPKITLPVGVHFVLLPNNELALSIDPGVELTSGELHHLQSLIQTLQRTLSATPKKENSNPIVIDENNENVNHEVVKETECSKESDTVIEKIDNEPNNSSTEVQSESQLECGNDIEKHSDVEKSNSNDNNAENENSKNVVNDSKDNIDTNSAECDTENSNINTTGDTVRKSIISHLMEMSGISEEDANVSEKPVLSNAETDSYISHSTTSDATGMHPDILRLFNTPVSLAALARRPDLSIITTYHDLKHSFENGARFFKLDVITGDISEINVVIKKKEEIHPITSTVSKAQKFGELIDLTDEDDSSDKIYLKHPVKDVSSTRPKKRKNQEKILPPVMAFAKPVKLFKAMHPSILKKQVLRGKGTEILTTAIRSGNSGTRVDGKTTFQILNVGRKTQHLDPTEEVGDKEDENLQNSTLATILQQTSCTQQSDESDEEPLAKLAKRKEKSKIDEEVQNTQLIEVSNHEFLDETTKPLNDSEEDCILGV
ncbi:unnamed protein product [Leptosia nina]|uniref:Uncharacterized protein n=1 Tax=Leptosia nina TaxID=320188 RepID=A0AAV1J580_9NEOP